MNSKNTTNILLYVSIGIFLFGLGYKAGDYHARTTSREQSNYNIFNASTASLKDKKARDIDFTLFWDTWNTLEERYVDKKKLDPQKMYYGAIKGMVASAGDPYTLFLSPDENKQSKDDLGGRFEGIGAQLDFKDNNIVVVAPLKESPAEKAGIKAGDIIVKVDGKSTKGWTLLQAVSKIRGTKGTKVTITVDRNGTDKDYTIVRDTIKVSSVDLSYKRPANCSGCAQVAYLKLSQFGERTNDDWDKAVTEIAQKWDSKEIGGMVLDLRSNPGGYLDGAVYTASEFLEKGKLVVKQESTTTPSKDYYVARDGKLLDIPLVVLINKGSASASEILAGALRDHKRAKLIGEKSFGKGSVQEALDMQDGAGLHVTVAKWILPKGDWIMGKGLEPDIKQALATPEEASGDADAQLEKAINTVENR